VGAAGSVRINVRRVFGLAHGKAGVGCGVAVAVGHGVGIGVPARVGAAVVFVHPFACGRQRQ